jgi:periplasmic divalent cation tolerance protein
MTALLALTNCENTDEANKLAHWLIQEKLAACVNILPAVQSVYRWQGHIETASEVTLFIKTTSTQFAAIKKHFLAQHSYELPELIAVEISDGLPEYLDWVCDNGND